LVTDDILGALYAPQRAFKKIVQNPQYLGPFILLIIFVVAQIGSSYVVASRSYIERTAPTTDQGDVWTENATLWAASSGVFITNNHADFINASSYYGSSSIQFAVNNSTGIQMALKDLGGSVNCGASGFQNISLRVKLVTPDVKPENVTLYLYSLSDLNFFYYDLTSLFSSNSSVNVWSNVTIPVGSGDWVSSNAAASWENITSLKMYFAWPSNSNIELRVDGLFFRGVFKTPLEISGVSYFGTSALNAITPFIFQWLLLTGLIYVIIKGLKGNVTWKPLMVAVGFALVTMVIQALILIAAYTALPKIYYPLEWLAGVPGESDVAYQFISNEVAQVSLVAGIIQVVVYVWIVALGAIITRDITAPVGEGVPGVQQFGWIKSILVSGASFLLTLLILGFILGI
jgi:hypothetical protein